MTLSRPPLLHRSGVRELTDSDLVDARALCAEDPVASVLAAAQFTGKRPGIPAGCELFGWWNRGQLKSLCWSGANLVPVSCDQRAAIAFAHHVRRRGRHCSSIVGDANAVDMMWAVLSDSWSKPREYRPHQPSMIMDTDPRIPGDPKLDVTSSEDFDLVFPACVSMFTEEVGYEPTEAGAGPAYAARVRSIIETGRSLSVIEDTDEGRTVIFKAEVGAVALGVAQIQGVWVDPRYRGLGRATAAMSSLVEYVRAQFAPVVSLYVNDFNTPALSVYRNVGFRQVGEYATVLF